MPVIELGSPAYFFVASSISRGIALSRCNIPLNSCRDDWMSCSLVRWYDTNVVPNENASADTEITVEIFRYHGTGGLAAASPAASTLGRATAQNTPTTNTTKNPTFNTALPNLTLIGTRLPITQPAIAHSPAPAPNLQQAITSALPQTITRPNHRRTRLH